MGRHGCVVDDESEWRQLEIVMRNREYCDTGCRFFESCPVQPLSYTLEDRKCLLKLYGEPLRRTFLNISLRGEVGVFDEMRRCVILYARKVEVSTALKDVRDYFDLLLKFHKAVYGEKGVQGVVPPLDVTIKQVGREVSTVDVAGGDVDDIYVSESQLCDPESLFYNAAYVQSKGMTVKDITSP